MNSHDSHDSDFSQDSPSVPDAGSVMPPAASSDEAGLTTDGDMADTLPDVSQDASLLDGAAVELSTPDLAVPTESTTEPFAPDEQATPEAPSSPAVEVWTELDEAEPDSPTFNEGAMAGSGLHREAEKPGRTDLPYDDWEPSAVPYQPKQLGILDQLMLVLADGAALWRRVLRQVRSWLPIQWQRTLSDELMTAIALGVLILWLVIWNPLGKQTAPAKVALEAPGQAAPTQPQDGERGARIRLTDNGDDVAPDSTVAAPAESLEPSPEQSLIADIQARVSTISRSYAVGLIQSVEVNLPQQVLSVNVSNAWYGLGAASQDRIAQDIYTQAQGLAFDKLQLRDAEGVVVARNPVVGTSMVVLKRHRPTEGDPLA